MTRGERHMTLLGGVVFIYLRTTYMFRLWTPVWSHAGPGGKLLLKTEVSWRNINGFAVNTPWCCVWIHFRRFSN